MMHKPGAHWSSELRFIFQFAQLCNGCGVRSPRNSKNIRHPDGYLLLSAEDEGFDFSKEATSF